MMYKRSLLLLSTVFISLSTFSQSNSFNNENSIIIFDNYVQTPESLNSVNDKSIASDEPIEKSFEGVIELDISKLRITSKKLTILLPNGDTLKFKNKYIETTTDGKLMWMGTDKSKNNAEIYVIYDEDELNATFNYNNRQYSLEQLSESQFGISSVEITNEHYEDESDSADSDIHNNHKSEAAIQTSLKQAITNAQSNGTNVIRLLAIRDVGLWNTANLNAGIQYIKDAIRNSHLDQHIQLDQVATVELDIPTRQGNFHNAFFDIVYGRVPAINEARDYHGADLVLIYIDSVLTHAGKVGALGVTNKDNAFFLIDADSTPIVYSHEFAHLFGGRHSNDASGTYEHGYTSSWVFNTPLGQDNGSPHINYYSTPDYSYQGRVLGTSHKNDVRRKMIEWAPIIAAINDIPTNKVDAPALNNPPMACYGQNSLFWTQEYGVGNMTYKVYRSNDRSMSNAFLQYSGSNLGTSLDITSFASHRHIAVKACDNNGCSNYSNVETLNYFNGCP